MTEKLKKEIINLAVNIFTDFEYEKFLNLLDNKEYNKIRLMIDEKESYLQVISTLEPYSSITDVQLKCAQQIEHYIVDLYVASLDENYEYY